MVAALDAEPRAALQQDVAERVAELPRLLRASIPVRLDVAARALLDEVDRAALDKAARLRLRLLRLGFKFMCSTEMQRCLSLLPLRLREQLRAVVVDEAAWPAVEAAAEQVVEVARPRAVVRLQRLFR